MRKLAVPLFVQIYSFTPARLFCPIKWKNRTSTEVNIPAEIIAYTTAGSNSDATFDKDAEWKTWRPVLDNDNKPMKNTFPGQKSCIIFVNFRIA